jgi:TonB family protein
MITLLALFAAPAPPVPPPPPIVSVDGNFETAVLSLRAGRARCESGEETLLLDEPTLPQISTRGAGAPPPSPVVLKFRIDADGRPLGIAEEAVPDVRGPYYNRRETVAAFAASRFRPGAERRGCTIAYEASVEPIDQADPAILYRLVALQPAPPFAIRQAVFERTLPAGSNCFKDVRLNVRLRAYPAFEEIPQRPGTLSHSFLTFDLDREGRPINIRLVGSGGNAELDRQSIDSVRRSRFSPIARLGCTYSYWRRGSAPLQAPEPPPQDASRSEDSGCPKDPWAHMPPLHFPPEFERRAIEGWAILKFDLAPWGGVGNVRVVEAEPAAAFGQQAMQILGGARKPASERGYTDCVARLLFRMGTSPHVNQISGP